MPARRTAIVATITLGLAAIWAPLGAAAAGAPARLPLPKARSGAIHWDSVRGTLKTYDAGSKATLKVHSGWVNHKSVGAGVTLPVQLAFKTYLRYSGAAHAAPIPAAGDWVTVNLKWASGKANAVVMAYNDNGATTPTPGANVSLGQSGTSRFHGSYVATSSSSTALALRGAWGGICKFALTDDTLYFEHGQQVASPALSKGMTLGVEASQQKTGAWIADAVLLRDSGSDLDGRGQHEDFSGWFQTGTPTILTLSTSPKGGARSFTTDANTRYFDQTDKRVSGLTYTAGEKVHVIAVEQADGTWLATRVEVGHLFGLGENHNFRGTYVAHKAYSVTVTDAAGNPETFKVNGDTAYFNASGLQVATLPYTAHEAVRVTAARQENGSWLATQVSADVASTKTPGDASEDFGGTFQSGTTNQLNITDLYGNVLTFTVNGSTDYFDQSGAPVSGLTYSTGEHLHVSATEQADGSWVANTVSEFTPAKAKAGNR
ncbi:MAG TPA: DUF5666 domain-containing protein [Chloroflexota bacterium]|nr:DUF5666 domain-containing protein [Chloroflexota bacterium]